jgi:hypothetical protein
MGIEKVKGKLKFTLKNKHDCIIYLGHIIEYLEKKIDIIDKLYLMFLDYVRENLKDYNLNFKSNDELLEWITENEHIENEENIEFNFYKFKLFNSSIEYEIAMSINLIGDFSSDKKAISYNNYIHIVKKNTIDGVKICTSKSRDKVLDFFRNLRNYNFHFTADKFCEWIKFKEKQKKDYPDLYLDFNTSKDFVINISDTIDYFGVRKQILSHQLMISYIKLIIKAMEIDFTLLIGEDVCFSIYNSKRDSSYMTISNNGLNSHFKSNKRF